MSMDQRVKGLWATRLRLNPEIQGSGALGTSDGLRCCLGVLCDIAVQEGVIDPPYEGDNGHLVYAGVSDYLPYQVCEWAGLTADEGAGAAYIYDPQVVPPLQQKRLPVLAEKETLSRLNDASVPFDAIATIIEDQL